MFFRSSVARKSANTRIRAQKQHAAGAIDNRVILHMLLEPPECGQIRESTATQQELVLARTLWLFRYRPVGKICFGAVDGELKLAHATTHHLFLTCRAPVKRA